LFSVADYPDPTDTRIEADIPAFLWGAPAIGKSQAIDQVAASLNMPVIDWRANLRDPIDVRGLPVTDIKAGLRAWSV
jgi:hypothetical protein